MFFLLFFSVAVLYFLVAVGFFRKMLLNRHMLCLINVFALYMSDYLSVPNNLSKKYDKNAEKREI